MDLRSLVDDGLEITLVGSFSRLGYAARRRLFGWQDPPPGALEGRTALVTGPTSGLGRATAEALAGLGARVILVGRDPERLAVVSRELAAAHGGTDRFPTVLADMSSLASVNQAVAAIVGSEARLDIVVDNAGAIYPERRLTAEGLEATFATMVVGPFVLISGLLPLLEESGDGRVISVVSGGMYGQALPLDDLAYESGVFNGTLAYARAKRASTALAREWARRLRGRPIRVNAMHPGWVDTPGLAASLPGFHGLMGPLLRTPGQGIDTIIWLASDPVAGVPGGRLHLDRRERPFDRLPSTRLSARDRRWLWDEVVRLAGVPDPSLDSEAPRRRSTEPRTAPLP
jgi:NAD(P)-dependent dehydrogenase (short-subunit alcohol dehydrogenase family)